MPEGEVLHRTAAAIRTAFVGRTVTGFDAPGLVGPVPNAGRVVELVECHGRHLEVIWDDGLTLHTNLRLNGVWHLYRAGERWRRPTSQLRVSLAVPGFVAACFNTPVVETFREFDRSRHPGFGPLGPDLSLPGADLATAVAGLRFYEDPEVPVVDAVLDHHVASGIGNVFRSEILWRAEIDPMAEVGTLTTAQCTALVRAAHRYLVGRLRRPATDAVEPLNVYGRNGQRCTRCGDTLEVRRCRQARQVYWCPGCQVLGGHRPIGDHTPREMDPHPAAAKFLAELPWRRDSLAG